MSILFVPQPPACHAEARRDEDQRRRVAPTCHVGALAKMEARRRRINFPAQPARRGGRKLSESTINFPVELPTFLVNALPIQNLIDLRPVTY